MPESSHSDEVDSPQSSSLRTFLIADIRGYTRFTDELGDEAGVRLAAQFAAEMRQGVEPHGGEVVELRGDEALAMFNSARQAVRSGVELQERFAFAAAESSLPLKVGIGMEAGEAVPFEGGYRGGALNMAARLCASAGAGEILVSETLVGLARKVEGIEYSERGYLELKGFGEPVRVLQVTGKQERASKSKNSQDKSFSDRYESEDEPRGPKEQHLPVGGFVGSLPSSPLVARENELEALTEVISQVEQGTGRLTLLSGEAGAGKTRLVQEMTVDLHSRGFVLGSGGCFETRLSTPFFPFLEALAQLYTASPLRIRKEVPRKWPHLARLLPDQNLPASSVTVAQDQERLFWSISGFLQALTKSAPVAMLFDDFHWADASSLELIQHLARHSRQHKILMVGTYRDADLTRNHSLSATLRDLTRQDLLQKISVGPLNEEDTAKFVGEALGVQELPDGFVHFLYLRTEGNVFFIQQLLRVLIDRGVIHREDGAWLFQDVAEVVVPETVRSVIEQRLGYLSGTTHDVLREASVLGQTFAFDDLQVIGQRPESEVDDAIGGATTAGILRASAEDSYAFDHALTQQVLYADLSPRRRRRLHSSVAQSLEDRARPARENLASEIALHFLRAGESARALPHVLQAGDHAVGVFANRQAEQQYRTGVEISREVEDREVEARALEKLGQVLRTQSRYAEALAEFETAARLAQESDHQEDEMRLMAQIGLTHAETGTTGEGIDRLENFLTSVLSSPHKQSLAALYSALSKLYYYDSRAQESLDVADLASALSSSLGDESLLAQADVRRGSALYLLGRSEEALRTLEGAMGLAEKLGDRENVCRALDPISSCYMIRGELGESKRCRERMLVVAVQIDDTGQIILAKAHLGLILSYMGEWDDAMGCLQSACLIGDRLGSSWYASYGRILLDYLGFLSGADTTLKSGTASDGYEHKSDTFLQALRAEQEILAGRPERAVDRLEPLQLKDDLGSPLLLATLAWAQLKAGHKQAERTSIISVAQAKKYKQAQHFVDALRVRAMVFREAGATERAESDLRVAVSLARNIPYILAEARALLEWGIILKEKGETEDGRRKLREALQLFQKLGATLYVRMAEDEVLEGAEG